MTLSHHPGGASPVTVDLWLWRLDGDPAGLAAYEALLSPDERARAQRFVYERHRRRYIVGRGRLRDILATYVGRPPQSLSFRYGANDKPAYDGPHFNLSHSADAAALGVCAERPLGLDIEEIKPFADDLPAKFFSQQEQAALAALPEAERLAGFYRTWTRKEAVLKALGGGLSIPLAHFAVSLDADDRAELLWMREDLGAASHWALAPFNPIKGFTAAVAADTGGRPLRLVPAPEQG